jgi:hypothetical protein
MPIVYVTQEVGNKNISPALKYGEIHVLLPPGQVTFSIGPASFELNRQLSKYTKDDYLLLIGDPIAIGLACAIAAKQTNGELKLLKWDKQEMNYIPLTMNIFHF